MSTYLTVWTSEDAKVLYQLASLAAERTSPAELASWLYEHSLDNEGDVLDEALRAADEATTAGDAALAVPLWLELLERYWPGLLGHRSDRTIEGRALELSGS